MVSGLNEELTVTVVSSTQFSPILSCSWPWISVLESVSKFTMILMARLELESAYSSVCKYAPCNMSNVEFSQALTLF